jgi:hypothetical protein
MARIPAAVRAKVETVDVGPSSPIAGIDVGEKFLDIAIADPRRRELRVAAVDLRELQSEVVPAIAAALRERAPEVCDCAHVIIDSPRFPARRRCGGHPCGRAIDATLRELVRGVNARRNSDPSVSFSLYPTPDISYFEDRSIYDSRKPYLLSIAREVLGLDPRPGRGRHGGGRLFTRFMLVGFAVYQAAQSLGLDAVEGFPHLAFAMWLEAGETLPPKRYPPRAFDARRAIMERLASSRGMRIQWDESRPMRRRIDEADAAVLALTAAIGRESGGLYRVGAAGEGRFLLPVSRRDRTAADDLINGRDSADSA